jgi:hypothetical protein
MKTKNEIENFLKSLKTEVDILGYINIEDIDHSDPFNSIYDIVQDNGGFDIDIIYYNDAINYLQQEDPSLKESIEIALEYGYNLKNINSEILASLLASRNAMQSFYELEYEINEFFFEL